MTLFANRRSTSWVSAAVVLGLILTGAPSAKAWHRGHAQTFAVLPDGTNGPAGGPEGLTVDPESGDVYVATFGFTSAGAVTGPGQLFVFSPSGRLLRNVGIANSSPHLLGLAFQPGTHALLVIDFGNGNVLNVNPSTGASTVFMEIGGNSGLNALTFDTQGNVYVSDSFQGIIWRSGPNGGRVSDGTVTAWVTDPLLSTSGVPPFGANGVEFNNAFTTLYVANTGNDTIVQIPVDANFNPGKPAIFVNSINGADGIAIDSHDNIWAAANQEDEIVVVSTNPKTPGRVIAKLGDFYGLTQNGTPQGLLFPASPAFSKGGQFLYVTNLALDLRLFSSTFVATDSTWCAQVVHYTVSRIEAHIPPVDGRETSD